MATQNLIQIKRSENTASPTGLANGELAWSGNGDILYIGNFGSDLAIGGARTPGTLTANQALVANSTSGIDKVIVANAVVTTITANGSIGSSGQILTSNGTVSYWGDPSSSSFTIAGDTGSDTFATGGTLTFVGGAGLATAITDDTVTISASVSGDSSLIANSSGLYIDDSTLSIATSQLTGDVALGTQTSGNYVATITGGAGLTGSGSSEGSTPTLDVGAGIGITVNADDVAINAQAGLTANTSGLWVDAGTGVTVNATGVHIGQGVGTSDNVTFNDLTVSGNLVVSGSVTEINTTQLTVEDNLIKLASNNSTDAVDFGFYGQYDDTGTKYAGLYRDASDGTGVFKLFDSLGTEPTSTTVGGGTLAALDVGALDASSLVLGSALAVSYGGTGKTSVTTNAILYGQGTGALSEATGTAYQVLQLNASGVPEFNSLDGGTF